MKRFFLFLAVLLTFFSVTMLSNQVNASHTKKAKGPGVSASVAKNRLSMSASFQGLSNVKSITYSLTYDSIKGPQGAGGTIKVGPKNKSLSRKLLFGTCSGKVCTYHKGVKNIKLSVDFTLKSGGVVSYEKTLR